MKKKLLTLFSMALFLMVGVVGVKAYSNVTQLWNNTNYSIDAGGKKSAGPLNSTGIILLANISPDQVYSGKTTFNGYYVPIGGGSPVKKAAAVYSFNASYSQFYIGNMGLPGTWKMENVAKYNGVNNIGWSGVLGYKSAV